MESGMLGGGACQFRGSAAGPRCSAAAAANGASTAHRGALVISAGARNGRAAGLSELHALHRRGAVVARANTVPQTVAYTKDRFDERFEYPLPALIGPVTRELLTQQHLYRYNEHYNFTPLSALGLMTIMDQLLNIGFEKRDGMQDEIMQAFFFAVDESLDQYRAESDQLLKDAASAGSAEAVASLPAFEAMRKMQSAGAESADSDADAAPPGGGTFLYTRYMAIGVFRILEALKSTDQKALETVVKACGLPKTKVNTDLAVYKDMLKKMQSGKELMMELVAREKKKKAEKDAAAAAAKLSGEDDDSSGKADSGKEAPVPT